MDFPPSRVLQSSIGRLLSRCQDLPVTSLATAQGLSPATDSLTESKGNAVSITYSVLANLTVAVDMKKAAFWLAHLKDALIKSSPPDNATCWIHFLNYYLFMSSAPFLPPSMRISLLALLTSFLLEKMPPSTSNIGQQSSSSSPESRSLHLNKQRQDDFKTENCDQPANPPRLLEMIPPGVPLKKILMAFIMLIRAANMEREFGVQQLKLAPLAVDWLSVLSQDPVVSAAPSSSPSSGNQILFNECLRVFGSAKYGDLQFCKFCLSLTSKGGADHPNAHGRTNAPLNLAVCKLSELSARVQDAGDRVPNVPKSDIENVDKKKQIPSEDELGWPGLLTSKYSLSPTMQRWVDFMFLTFSENRKRIPEFSGIQNKLILSTTRDPQTVGHLVWFFRLFFRDRDPSKTSCLIHYITSLHPPQPMAALDADFPPMIHTGGRCSYRHPSAISASLRHNFAFRLRELLNLLGVTSTPTQSPFSALALCQRTSSTEISPAVALPKSTTASLVGSAKITTWSRLLVVQQFMTSFVTLELRLVVSKWGTLQSSLMSPDQLKRAIVQLVKNTDVVFWRQIVFKCFNNVKSDVSPPQFINFYSSKVSLPLLLAQSAIILPLTPSTQYSETFSALSNLQHSISSAATAKKPFDIVCLISLTVALCCTVLTDAAAWLYSQTGWVLEANSQEEKSEKEGRTPNDIQLLTEEQLAQFPPAASAIFGKDQSSVFEIFKGSSRLGRLTAICRLASSKSPFPLSESSAKKRAREKYLDEFLEGVLSCLSHNIRNWMVEQPVVVEPVPSPQTNADTTDVKKQTSDNAEDQKAVIVIRPPLFSSSETASPISTFGKPKKNKMMKIWRQLSLIGIPNLMNPQIATLSSLSEMENMKNKTSQLLNEMNSILSILPVKMLDCSAIQNAMNHFTRWELIQHLYNDQFCPETETRATDDSDSNQMIPVTKSGLYLGIAELHMVLICTILSWAEMAASVVQRPWLDGGSISSFINKYLDPDDSQEDSSGVNIMACDFTSLLLKESLRSETALHLIRMNKPPPSCLYLDLVQFLKHSDTSFSCSELDKGTWWVSLTATEVMLTSSSFVSVCYACQFLKFSRNGLRKLFSVLSISETVWTSLLALVQPEDKDKITAALAWMRQFVFLFVSRTDANRLRRLGVQTSDHDKDDDNDLKTNQDATEMSNKVLLNHAISLSELWSVEILLLDLHRMALAVPPETVDWASWKTTLSDIKANDEEEEDDMLEKMDEDEFGVVSEDDADGQIEDSE